MLVLTKRQGITDDQILGTLPEMVAQFKATASIGVSDFGGYWVTIANDEGSAIVNAAKSVNRVIRQALKDIPEHDLPTRRSIALGILNQCSVTEVIATEPPAEGQRVGAAKKNPDGSFVKRWILTSQRGERFTAEDMVEQAKAVPTVNLKLIMSNRV